MLSPSYISLFCMQTSWNTYGNIIWCCSWRNWEERVEWFAKDQRDYPSYPHLLQRKSTPIPRFTQIYPKQGRLRWLNHVWAPSTWTSLGSLPVVQCPSPPSQLSLAFGSYPEGLDAGIREHNIMVLKLILGQTTEGRIKCAWSTGLEKSPKTYLNLYIKKVRKKRRGKNQIWSVLWIKL